MVIVAIEDGGLGWARWRLPICVGLMVASFLYIIMCGVFGEGLPLYA